MRRSSFKLDVPTGFVPHIVERNLVPRRQEDEREGRHRFQWTAIDQMPLRAEPFAADSNGIAQSITVSAPGDWNGMASWYNTLARDRYVVSPTVGRVADSVMAASHHRAVASTLCARGIAG